MRKYVPIGELADSSILTQTISGEELDLAMMDNTTESLAEDAFWADELDGEIGSMIARASKDRSVLQSKIIRGLARAPKLISLARTGE